MYLNKMKLAVSLLIIAWFFVSCALSQDGNGDNGMQGGSNDENGYQFSDNGQGYNNGQGSDNSQYYMDEQPEDSGGLTDLGPADDTSTSVCPPGAFCDIAPSPSKCSAWITDSYGVNKLLSLDIPLNRWARLEIRTCAYGNLEIYERKSNGIVTTYDLGYASANRKYRMWFFADSYGTHTVWFMIGGQTSNTITFNVGGFPGRITPSGGISTGVTQPGVTLRGGVSTSLSDQSYGYGQDTSGGNDNYLNPQEPGGSGNSFYE